MLIRFLNITLLSFVSIWINAATSQNFNELFQKAMTGNKQSADSLMIYSSIDNTGEAADYYAFLLGSSSSPFYDHESHKIHIENWFNQTEPKANQGDADACLALGRALIGDFYNLRPFSPDYDSTERGISYMLQSAMKGDRFAQYLYAIYNPNISDNEKELWIGEAAKQGLLTATIHKAILELDKSNYDNALSLLNNISPKNLNYIFNHQISAQELKTLATFLKNNPNFSLNGFGPIKNDKTTFYLSRDGIIIACANFKGKAGLLQLNSDGERINHDGIPFIYDYIVPQTDEQLVLSKTSLFFQVSPYSFKIPAKENEIRVLDKSGTECYYNMWSAHGPAIPVPDEYIFDGE